MSVIISKSPRTFAFLMKILMLAIISTRPSMSGDKRLIDCPQAISPDNPIVEETWYGVPLAREYYLNPMGVWFKLPLGYMNPWPNRDGEVLLRQRTLQNPEVPGLQQATALGFAFWMPSLRWPERDRFSVPSYVACEDGRALPRENEYIVEVYADWVPFAKKKSETYSNSKRFIDLLITGGALNFEDSSIVYDLVKPLSLAENGNEYYFTQTKDKMDGYFICNERDPNPLCSGKIWDSQKNIGIRISFPYGNIKNWREAIEATIFLIKRFHEGARYRLGDL